MKIKLRLYIPTQLKIKKLALEYQKNTCLHPEMEAAYKYKLERCNRKDRQNKVLGPKTECTCQ